jgi:hypothetical protein
MHSVTSPPPASSNLASSASSPAAYTDMSGSLTQSPTASSPGPSPDHVRFTSSGQAHSPLASDGRPIGIKSWSERTALMKKILGAMERINDSILVNNDIQTKVVEKIF